MATRPATTPEAAPIDVALPSLSFSTSIHPSIAAHVATAVLIHTRAAVSSGASSDPTLNPNQPNHSRPAPIMTTGTLCGRMAILPKPSRLPTMIARTRPAMPALMWTTVPPAKSMGVTFAAPSVDPKISEDRLFSAPERSPPPQTM